MPDLNFFAEPNPTREQCESLAELYPINPFATYQYFIAQRLLGSTPLLLGCRTDDRMVFGCFAIIQRGRLISRLSVASLPCTEEPFLVGIKAFCSRSGVTTLELNTFSSLVSSIPLLGEELNRAKRHEFVMPLNTGSSDLSITMSHGHRLSVRKAAKLGLQVRVACDREFIARHIAVIGSSMSRREARGEQVVDPPSQRYLEAFLGSGLCALYQAMGDGDVLSSMTVAMARKGAYLHTSGTSQKGMGVGASQFLLYEILKDCQQRDISVFNFGGVSDLNSGLADYKRRFGAQAVPLEMAEFYLASSFRRRATSWIDKARGIWGVF